MRAVLITGAYGGMGRAAVKLMRERGFLVFALDRTVGEAEDGVVPIRADVTSEEELRAAFETVRAHTERLYAIVHFSGIYMLDSLVEMEDEAFCRIFNVNLRGAYLVNKIFLPLLARGSRILITTSELAPLAPLPFTGIYAVTKSALDDYAYSLGMELQLLGIRVSVLRAGAVSTNMLGVSTDALSRFCGKTERYVCNAERFRQIVDRVEAKSIPAEALAERVGRILDKKNPSFAYSINRNPLLRLLNALPRRTQMWIIATILKKG